MDFRDKIKTYKADMNTEAVASMEIFLQSLPKKKRRSRILLIIFFGLLLLILSFLLITKISNENSFHSHRVENTAQFQPKNEEISSNPIQNIKTEVEEPKVLSSVNGFTTQHGVTDKINNSSNAEYTRNNEKEEDTFLSQPNIPKQFEAIFGSDDNIIAKRTSGEINTDQSLELSNSTEARGLSIEESQKLYYELLPIGPTFIDKQNNLLVAPSPIRNEIFKPREKYSLGIDIGYAQYKQQLFGRRLSLYGVYHLKSYLAAGLQFSNSDMSENTNFTMSPNIRRRTKENSIRLFAQCVPLRISKISLGIDAGYGRTFETDFFRRQLNPSPNVVTFVSEEKEGSNDWFYLGLNLMGEISTNIDIGITAGTNTTTESTNISGRVVYRY